MPSTILNPATNRKVKRSGRIGKAILATQRSLEKKKKKTASKRSGAKTKSKVKKGKGECSKHNGSRKRCVGNPNCVYRPKSKTCRKSSSSVVYQGPMWKTS